MDAVLQGFFVILCLCNFFYAVFGQNTKNSSSLEQQETLSITCDSTTELNNSAAENLNINCSQPDIIYSQFLKTLKIGKLKSLNILIHPPKDGIRHTLKDTQFENLDVENLNLEYTFENFTGTETFLPLNSNLVYVLKNVKNLQLRGFILNPSLKEPSQLNSSSPCNGCCIESLRIETSDFRNISEGWLSHCKSLRNLYIAKLRQRNGTKEVRRKLLFGLRSLRVLEIHECYVEELNDEMQDLVSLQRLNVAHNQIHYALTTTILPALEELDLSHNHIFASSLFSAGVERLSRLRVISLDYNKVLDMCDQLDYRMSYNDEPSWQIPLSGRRLNLPLVQRFSLRGTITSSMCFENMIMDSLEYFDVSDSRITIIHFKALPKTKSRRLEINVTGCPIKDIPAESFTEENYKQLYHEELRLTGLNVTLDCDCDQHFWLARAVRDRRLVLDRVHCTTKEDFSAIQEERLNCTKYHCGACTCRRYWQTKEYHECTECVCKRYWKDNSTEVECSGELRAIPPEPGLRKLHAAGNLVENITAADIPDTLIFLDVSKNHIARMSAEASVALFKNKKIKVRFQGNPIICDCENKDFIQQLMDHYHQVEDYTLLTCIDDGRFIRDVNPSELCFTTSRIFSTSIMAVLGGGIGLIGLCGGLYYRYGQALKVFLFSRGLCLFCIKEEELDADRPYDAFISFSHRDYEFVMENLLPGLENEPYAYNICVHYRNWVAGELIPSQIEKSIEESKRTIIVLSKNFLESFWGLLEFRTAHLSALREGRSRLIIIILDDILNDESLDGELRSYLRNNTYVKWGDPWFWNKIRYALPHRPNSANVTIQRQNPHMSHQELTPSDLNTVSTDSAIEMEHLSSSSCRIQSDSTLPMT